MFPILFKIGSVNFYTHGILTTTGIFGSAYLVYLLARQKFDCRTLFDNVTYATLGGIITARITYFLLYRDQFDNFDQIFHLWEGGFVSYGGLLPGGALLYLILKKQKQPIWEWFDLFSIGLPLAITMARIGNFLGGEYFGLPNRGVIAVENKIPLTLIEAIWTSAVFLFLLFFYQKTKNRIRPGLIFATSAGLYTGGRFIIDFWRDEKDLLLGVSLGQIASLMIFLTALALFISFKSKHPPDRTSKST